MSAHTAMANAIIRRADAARVVVFPARARVEKTDVGQRRIFESRCGRYRIVETRFSCTKLVAQWRAMKRDALGWTNVEGFRTFHRKYVTCLAAIERDALAATLAAANEDHENAKARRGKG